MFNPKARNDLTGCKMCGRNFAEDRIEKHEEVCAKTFNKKRKQFDMTKARVKGTDAAKFVMGKGGRQTAAKERIILIIQIYYQKNTDSLKLFLENGFQK